jgi:DNA-binding NarL/FixJ family response regulator
MVGVTTRVLIVDDHPSFRHAARELLAARGYAVVGEADGSSTALDALARLQPDAVLLDLCLGAECGFDVARALTQARPGLAVLLVSTDEPDACSARIRECGARGFLLKLRLADADLRVFWPPRGE